MKKIKAILLALTLFFGSTLIVNAASLNVNEYLSSDKVSIGDTVTVTVKLSSSSSFGAINYTVTYDSEKLTHTSGNLNDVIFATDNTTKSANLTFKFKAKANGNATINFKINEAYDFEENTFSSSNASKTVTIITPEEKKATYSSDNNLSKLGVEGYSITPAFNKNTTTYSLEVENEVTSIKVTGTKSDSKASTKGLGDHSLEEGVNKIEVKVTAQNGNSKTYVINVTRKELAPIIVKVDDVEYNVVRKEELLTEPNTTFTKSTLTLGEENVPSLINEASGITLLGLKDSEGNVTLYEYKDGNYTKYNEIKEANLIIIPINGKIDNMSYYEETTLDINGVKYIAYTRDNSFYVLKGKNIETGEESVYQYNAKDGSIQLFNNKDLMELMAANTTTEKRIMKRNIVIIVLALLLVFTYVGILISLINKKNKKKKKKEKKEKIEKEEE